MTDVLDEEVLFLPICQGHVLVYYTFGFPEKLRFVYIPRLMKRRVVGCSNMTVDIAGYIFMYTSGYIFMYTYTLDSPR